MERNSTRSARPKARPKPQPKPKPKPKSKLKTEPGTSTSVTSNRGRGGRGRCRGRGRGRGKGRGSGRGSRSRSPTLGKNVQIKTEKPDVPSSSKSVNIADSSVRSISPTSDKTAETTSDGSPNHGQTLENSEKTEKKIPLSNNVKIKSVKKESPPSVEIKIPAKSEKAIVKDWKDVEKLWDMETDPLDPLTLPFVGEEYQRVNEDLSTLFAKAETGMASLEMDANQQRRVMVIQLPQALPLVEETTPGMKIKAEPGLETASENKKEKNGHSEKNRLGRALPGKVGKIKLHKSGKARLWLGETVFDLDPGFNCAFQEEAVHIDYRNKKFVSISGINGRVICTPNLASLMKRHICEERTATESDEEKANSAISGLTI